MTHPTVQRSLSGLIALMLGAGSLVACVASPDPTAEFSAESAALSTGSGLHADYFSNRSLTAPAALSRTDATVNFNWGTGSPGASLPSDHFSVRWTGQVEALYSETYTFTTTSDDGIRLWVNGQQIINNWTDHGRTQNSGTIALTAGQRSDIRLEFYENAGSAIARLSWASSSQPKQIIPSAQLYPPSTGGTGGTTGTGGGAGATGGGKGGAVGTGGVVGTGGATATGGTPGTGGATATGGTPGTGGATGSGGTTSTGGTPGTGGPVAIPTHCTGALPAGARPPTSLIPPP